MLLSLLKNAEPSGIAVALVAIYFTPNFAQKVIAALRDARNFRDGR